MTINDKLYEFLIEQVNKHGALDVGVGVEREFGVSRRRLNRAVAKLAENGYRIRRVRISKLSNYTCKFLIPPEVTQ